MPLNRTTIARIFCNSHSDGILLSGKLSSSSAWPGTQPPDQVIASGAAVEAIWFTVTVPAVTAQAAVNTARTGLTGILTLNHTASGTTTTSKH